MRFRRTRRFGGRRRFGRRRSIRTAFRRFSKKGGKRRSGKASKIRIRQPSFFADSTYVKLHYHARVNKVVGASPAVYMFALNDIWDPDLQIGGKTAYGQEYWAQFYKYFTVFGSKISINFISIDASVTNQALDVVLWPSASTTFGADNDFNSCIPYAKQKIVQGASGRSGYLLYNYMSTSKIMGVAKKRVADDPNFSGQTVPTSGSGGSGPNSAAAWFISLQSADRLQNTSTTMNIRLTYYVKFYGRKIPLWSTAPGDTNYPSHAFTGGPTGGFTGPYGPTGVGAPIF